MDFGDILDKWDAETSRAYGKKRVTRDATQPDRAPAPQQTKAHPVDVWMRRNGIEDKDADDTQGSGETPAQRRRRLLSAKCEAVIDLHGCTRDEAWSRLSIFFEDCLRRGLKKVRIIHGKGMHSGDNPVLRSVVRNFLEHHAHAGESGESDRDEGGSGATWVLLK